MFACGCQTGVMNEGLCVWVINCEELLEETSEKGCTVVEEMIIDCAEV